MTINHPAKRFLLFCIILFSVAVVSHAQTTVTEGVSHELATVRATLVEDVVYTLHFDIPVRQADPVTGTVTVAFGWNGGKGTHDLQLDFQGQITGDIMVNGKKMTTDHRKEHIIIPAKRLSKKKRNEVTLTFRSEDKALNRNSDYMYTLFVPDHARSVFPSFDQPDIKARYNLSLSLPEGWTAISNGKVAEQEHRMLRFDTTNPLPTYLFSFTAGHFKTQTATRDGRTLTAIYRETDPAKEAQLGTVFDLAALSLRWMEDYTGIGQPFKKYGFVVLPGYQFGGMEHPGCIQFRDQTIFLGENATIDEEMNRLHLIAHETAHLWFGDLVTMRWFDDVWTKEVFANFMADKIAREQYPDINHDINFLKTHYVPSLATDRTEGTHPIQQTLDNLKDAGLLYGNIIYHKAPVMMRQLEKQMGEDPFRMGLRKYLQKFSYGNATWDDLIAILDEENPPAAVKAFDRQWVKQKGMAEVTIDINGGQFDPFVYGHYTVREGQRSWLLDHWHTLPETQRFAGMMYIYESYLNRHIDNQTAFSTLFKGLSRQDNPLVQSTCNSYLLQILSYATSEERPAFEKALYEQGIRCDDPSQRRQLLRGICQRAVTPQIVDSIYQLWKDGSDKTFNERDYMRMAYHLALVKDSEWKDIISIQRQRLTNADMMREFDFISRGCDPDPEVQQQLFDSLLLRENRATEPYAAALLSLLNDPLREPYNNRYITPGLEILEEVQRTGDIFFPLDWCEALLDGHRSGEAKGEVTQFLHHHPDYPVSLRNKLVQAAYYLLRVK